MADRLRARTTRSWTTAAAPTRWTARSWACPAGATDRRAAVHGERETATVATASGTVTVTTVRCATATTHRWPGSRGRRRRSPSTNTPPAAITALAASQVKTGNDGDGTTQHRRDVAGGGERGHGARLPGGLRQLPRVRRSGGRPAGAGDAAAGRDLDAGGGRDRAGRRCGTSRRRAGSGTTWRSVEDSCGNVSAVSNMTGGTLNYHLGDVMGGGPSAPATTR